MRTFKLTLSIDMKAVVPEQFIGRMRADAQHSDASEFLQQAQSMFPLPTQDDEFILHILKHGVRRNVRAELAKLFESSGLGCTLSPATATVLDTTPKCST